MSEVIVFDGTKKRGNVNYLVFSVVELVEDGTSKSSQVEIPVDQKIADHVMIYLGKNTKPDSKPVERGNDEDSI